MKPSNKITIANHISLQMPLMAVCPNLVSRYFSRSASFEYIVCSLHPLEKTVAYGVKRRHAHHVLAHRRNPHDPAGDDERRAGPRNRLARPARRHYLVFRGGSKRSIRFRSIVQRAATPFSPRMWIESRPFLIVFILSNLHVRSGIRQIFEPVHAQALLPQALRAHVSGADTPNPKTARSSAYTTDAHHSTLLF